MNVDELKATLEKAGVNEDRYRIEGMTLVWPPEPVVVGGERRLGRLPSDGSIYLYRKGDRWEFGSWERGKYDPEQYFDSEDEACEYVHEYLTRPTPESWYKHETEEESEAAFQRSQKQIAEMRRFLVEAGLSTDPRADEDQDKKS